MMSLYEVPVTLECDEEEMCVYVTVSSSNEVEAARKAEEIVMANITVSGDSDDAVKI